MRDLGELPRTLGRAIAAVEGYAAEVQGSAVDCR
jgi:hypothetical protein